MTKTILMENLTQKIAFQACSKNPITIDFIPLILVGARDFIHSPCTFNLIGLKAKTRIIQC